MRKVWAAIKRLPFHPNPRSRTVISLIYILAALWVNFFVAQVFCVPVWWAALALALFFVLVILVPFFRNSKLRYVLYFFIGAGVPICIYCTIFLADPWEYFTGYFVFLLFGLLLGAGLLGLLFALLPVYFLYHIWRYFKIASSREKIFLFAGALVPFIMAVYYLFLFGKSFHTFELAVAKGPAAMETLPRNYFTERMLGMGFKYHTKIKYLWDGWRPPLHDPLLNTGLWFYSDDYLPFGHYPFQDRPGLTLPDRIKYYTKLFPQKPVRLSCPCSYNGANDGESYFTDYGWGGYFEPVNPPVKAGGN